MKTFRQIALVSIGIVLGALGVAESASAYPPAMRR